ncbi:MAG: GFA family protein [Candidatus Marinimicrobia bacterium]|jgi:hypothetical protein|nr:GFA family protein [Candidatus Neomarinimicrobiota bacterium]MBT3502409.1 GFA family protein [Candidatus Neomarinimicrobiota bacterium]MBT3838793.1 GFA family protein [Candidatus Neomarinimicrobiota bacterium]MBT3999633.1 GFA family protein [Candidatus Neomarinimicrobiota bacterium]MBT4578802.1 GFA family protein [Candidatus Neomarinimicrobiota bacterium]
MKINIQGGCFCGKIRLKAKIEPISVVNCHCDNCKRSVGSPFVTWAVFKKDAISFNSPPPTHTAENRAVRTFCESCGTSIAYWHPDRKDTIDITVGCLDKPDNYPPNKNIWTKKRLSWVQNPDDIPNHEAFP